MALARVVTFEGVDASRMQEMRDRMQGEKPEGLPASELLVLHDADAERAMVIVFFDNAEDYATGDTFLSSMPSGDTPGQRSSITRYEVAHRMAG